MIRQSELTGATGAIPVLDAIAVDLDAETWRGSCIIGDAFDALSVAENVADDVRIGRMAMGRYHDLGKIDPAVKAVVAQPRVLSLNEKAICNQHTVIGYFAIEAAQKAGDPDYSAASSEVYRMAKEAALGHHTPCYPSMETIEELIGSFRYGDDIARLQIIDRVEAVTSYFSSGERTYMPKRLAKDGYDVQRFIHEPDYARIVARDIALTDIASKTAAETVDFVLDYFSARFDGSHGVRREAAEFKHVSYLLRPKTISNI